jgi:hypothetical protein
MRPERAVLVAHFGDLGLLTGEWPIIGRVDPWHRGAWTATRFARYEELTKRYYMSEYEDDDPGEFRGEVRIDRAAAETLPPNGLYGSGAIEIVLTDRLSR